MKKIVCPEDHMLHVLVPRQGIVSVMEVLQFPEKENIILTTQTSIRAIYYVDNGIPLQIKLEPTSPDDTEFTDGAAMRYAPSHDGDARNGQVLGFEGLDPAW